MIEAISYGHQANTAMGAYGDKEPYHNVNLSEFTAPRDDPELRKTFDSAGNPFHSWYPGPKYDGDACVADPETGIVYEIKLDSTKEGNSKLLNGKLLYQNPELGIEEEITVREYLDIKGVDNIVPFAGYGSNRSPGQMANKFSSKSFKKYEDLFNIEFTQEETLAQKDPIIMVKGKGPGNVVYINRVSNNYQQPFALHVPPSDGISGEAEAWVTYITDRQIRPLHASENVYKPDSHYNITKIDVETPIGKTETLAYGQAGTAHVLTNEKGEPVRLSAIEAYNSSISDSKETVEVLDMIRQWVNKDMGTNFETVEDFQNNMEDRPFADRVNRYLAKYHTSNIEIKDTSEAVSDINDLRDWYIQL